MPGRSRLGRFRGGGFLSLAASVAIVLLAGPGVGPALGFPAFDGSRALERVEEQCAFGPRVPGTKGHALCLEWILEEVRATGLSPERYDFRVPAPAGPDTLDLTNVLVRISPERTPRILIGAHWDTRPWSDQEKDPKLRELPVPGANDGASGVSVLLGLAELMAVSAPPIGIDLVFFDGEDQGRSGNPREYSLGSQWMARNWTGPGPDYVLVLDMIGTPQAVFGRDIYALQVAPDWNDLIYRVAESRGYSEFDPTRVYDVFDDHIPFLERGIPSAVVIGFDDPNWHTQRDVPSAVSGERLRRVGEVVLEIVYGGYLGAGGTNVR